MNRSWLNGEEAKVNSSKENLKHTKWECKYHVVFIPKYRRKVMYGWIRKELGPIMRELAQQKESEVEEGHLMGDHVQHDVVDPAEVFGIRGGGVHQGEECDSDCTKIYGSDEELCWVEFLGEGLLRVDGGAGRGAGAKLHQRARERRSSTRSTEDVRIGSVPA